MPEERLGPTIPVLLILPEDPGDCGVPAGLKDSRESGVMTESCPGGLELLLLSLLEP